MVTATPFSGEGFPQSPVKDTPAVAEVDNN